MVGAALVLGDGLGRADTLGRKDGGALGAEVGTPLGEAFGWIDGLTLGAEVGTPLGEVDG